MTAPTSPGVVPADVLALATTFANELRAANTLYGVEHRIARAIMADRANRPSLTEDEREQVRREALEEAAQEANDGFPGQGAAMGTAGRIIADRLRALAVRSEPRQEKEGDRG